MKQRYVRAGDELTDETVVIVRGGELRRELLEVDARRAFTAYGTYAISVFAADGVTVDELAQAQPLVRFELLTLMTVGAIRAAGLVIRPTGRNRLHHSIDFDDLDAGIERLLRCETARRSTRTMRREHADEVTMETEFDLRADLNAEDDDGHGWSLLSEA